MLQCFSSLQCFGALESTEAAAMWRSSSTETTHWGASSTPRTHTGITTAVARTHAFATEEVETIVDVEHHVAVDAVILRVTALHGRDGA